ncbi:SymE family type I addiction module toxin [Flavobacterium johnsoniae]|uniref:SymE family type I addiction module toxin n=1 Tax=Flavobacterium johnsoniae TaxID=986 RepID=UPI0002FF9B38|nr:SymE family type I addiction module toxin [Flavobacterium johnsoniae]OXE98833.1 type I addiction module toxin, SymE family [Flavobacterium johnsoniae UW101]WQG81045.1 SymE family type I addiction module toxin [Flavobacterium johnsoniae UW101]SHL29871.1 Toxin SymE, type I toxin-antitoxin system [Flavobacterium johnsoniae]
MKQSVKRRLKIQPKTISRRDHRYVIFPEIRLYGKWLQKIGFNYGNFVTIAQQQNKIIITTNNEIEIK